MLHYALPLFLLLFLPNVHAFGQELKEAANEMFISQTDAPFPLIDGKWTLEGEWARSTERVFIYEDEAKIAIRVAHERENIYALLDVVSDRSMDSGMDKAVICFDTELNGGNRADVDDYCFMAVLDGSFTTYKGGATTSNSLSVTDNPEGVEMKAGVSDAFDRYSKIPHLAYELKVPIESLKRTDVLGFYAAVFDSNTKTTYSWPISLSHGDDIGIKEPSEWGKLISPDKSIPEFPSGIAFVAGIILLSMILMTRGNVKLRRFGYS